MQPRQDRAPEPRSSPLRRWGPIAAVMTVLVVVTAVALTRGGGDGGDGQGGGTTVSTEPIELPEGAVTWSMAQDRGLDVTFPETCDEESGMVAIPFIFRSECFANVDDNGGATARGVTGDTIKVVAWLPAEDDPVRALVLERVGFDATNAELRETYQGFVDVFARYYQTYGRKVTLDFIEASGSILDPTASRSDAVRAAEDMGAFAVLGGPLIGSAWTEELHARGVVCIACPGISKPEPSVFSLPPTAGQIRAHFAKYVSEKLAGEPAEFAGEGSQGEPRVFGHLALGMSEGDEAGAKRFKDMLADEDVELAEQVLYPLDPGRAAELATNAVAKMQAADVTTVLVQADPILLPAFTAEATKQGWYPEWVLGGSVFSDTTAFARTFDPDQWEHAFGISYLPPSTVPRINPPVRLYEWFHGERPPVDATLPLLLIYPQVTLFFTGLEYAGPNLTAETFRNGLFVMPPTPRATTQPSVSYGEERWEDPDYAGIDDMVELWWDPDAEGLDESGDEGTGMYQYANGAKRYLVDEWDDSDALFEPEGAITIIEELPEDERPPDYPSPAGGG